MWRCLFFALFFTLSLFHTQTHIIHTLPLNILSLSHTHAQQTHVCTHSPTDKLKLTYMQAFINRRLEWYIHIQYKHQSSLMSAHPTGRVSGRNVRATTTLQTLQHTHNASLTERQTCGHLSKFNIAKIHREF